MLGWKLVQYSVGYLSTRSMILEFEINLGKEQLSKEQTRKRDVELGRITLIF